MSDPFVHLHVSSGYSLRYGASHPSTLVERAASHGQDALALTDLDGVYGAVKFVAACRSAGVRPLLGVNLAVTPMPLERVGGSAPERVGSITYERVGGSAPERVAGSAPERVGGSAPERRLRVEQVRTPARGGVAVDPRHPRVTVLAQDATGWAAMCRLISATHLTGERGKPVTSLDLLAEHARSVFVMLGPDSDVARALARRRPDLAAAHLARWRAAVPRGSLLVEVVCHRGEGDAVRAARLLGFAAEAGVPAVLTNAVRYADRSDAPVADVLDAARRLVVLDHRNVDRRTAEGYLKSGKEMAAVAEEVAQLAGADPRTLLTQTRRVAEQCALATGAGGLGLGEVHFPELGVAGVGPGAADAVLRARCDAGFGRRGLAATTAAEQRLEDELTVIRDLGYPSYFLTVADVVDLIRSMQVRCAARGSGAGSLVTYLLGISDVDPLEHGLLMERFLSPLRHQLPDVDIDVESARRTEVYEAVLARFGGERCACVSMMDTYRARHAIRDVGAALGMAPGEIDTIAKAFPHVRASQVRAALRDLPELRASGLGGADGRGGRLDLLFRLVERLDGLPRHIALHPCGVLLSDATLLDRTPVEASWLGFPMSQFDKDDVEEMGLLKLDLLGIRMQSAIAHAVGEARRVDGVEVDVDGLPRDDPATFDLIRSTKTLGCFQIESPGQRELIGKFAPATFADVIIDISLFRPGPVKTDMVTPFLQARQGWREPAYFCADLEPILAETYGVVVFHEQVLRIVAWMTGCTLAEADEVRRALGDPLGQPDVRTWFVPTALGRGYQLDEVERAWEVLKGFGSFGFCKAHAAAFAVPTYQSAWLKAHHTAAFFAGVLTHDPGMYPKRLILDDARQFGIAVLPLDVNRSDDCFRIERVGLLDEPPPEILGGPPRVAPEDPRLPDGRAYGIRLSLADVSGITEAEIARIVGSRPYSSLSDFWHRAAVSRPIAERLVLAGAFDEVYGIGSPAPVRRRGMVSRRDLLLQVAELAAWHRPARRGLASAATTRRTGAVGLTSPPPAFAGASASGPRSGSGRAAEQHLDVRVRAAAQSQAAAAAARAADLSVQLAFDLGDAEEQESSGLPDMTAADRVRAELDVLGLDASRHILDFYAPFLDSLGVVRSRSLLSVRSRADVFVAGVKVATQTPPIRSGRRVVFVTLDDATGPVDATFFEDAQVGYASTLFHSWLLVVRGVTRRTGPRGISLRATGCWELPLLHGAWRTGGFDAVTAVLARPPGLVGVVAPDAAVHGAADSRSTRPVLAAVPGRGRGGGGPLFGEPVVAATGFAASPYADVKPAGSDPLPGRKLWHASPGSSGR